MVSSADTERPLPHSARLAGTGPYDLPALLAAHRAHLVEGLERVESLTGSEEGRRPVITRAVRHRGAPGLVRIRPERAESATGPAFMVESTLPLDADLVRRVRFWLDLDADPDLVWRTLGGDPKVGALVRRRPGLRILGQLDGFEAAVFAVLGQQVSLAAARTFQRRFVAAFSEPIPGTSLRVFPRADAVAAHGTAQIRDATNITRARAATVAAVAQAFADGLDLRGAPPEQVRAELTGIRGVGAWTADYLSVRAVGDRDAFPDGDLVLRRAMGGVDRAEARQRAQSWSPLRAYAAFHLWTEHAYCPQKTR